MVFHSWETSRLRVKNVDTARNLVTFTGPSCWPFEAWGKGQRYYVEYTREALDAPGEWYLDHRSGTLLYYPLPGEDMKTADVVAPRLTHLLDIKGDGNLGLPVSDVTFRGLSFQHEDFVLEPEGHSDPQAVVKAPAAIDHLTPPPVSDVERIGAQQQTAAPAQGQDHARFRARAQQIQRPVVSPLRRGKGVAGVLAYRHGDNAVRQARDVDRAALLRVAGETAPQLQPVGGRVDDAQ